MEITTSEPRLGLSCMRLSTAPDRDDERSISVIHAALDAWKPIPGSILEFVLRARVALDRSLLVTCSQADRTMGQRLRVPIISSDQFFSD